MKHLAILFLTALILVSFNAKADDYDNLFSPANAFGGGLDPLPEHSRLAGQNEFYNRFKEGSLVLDLPQQAAAAERTRAGSNQALEAKARSMFRGRATLVHRTLSMPDGFDAPVLVQNQKKKQKVILMARDAAVRDLVGAAERLNSRENLRAIYDYLQSRLAGEAGLPTVDPITADAATLRLINDQLLARLEMKFGRDQSVPMSDFGRCEMEDGSGPVATGNEGDQTGEVCEANPIGLVNASDWALRTAATCVRNQGERGTSAAFALAGAVETRIARDEQRFSNLSEQHLYSLMAARWFRSLPDNDDNIAPIFSSGISSTTGYKFHYEDMWSYNTSYGRTEVYAPVGTKFNESCKVYKGRHCSNTNHQGRMLCTVVGQHRFCGYDTPMQVSTPIQALGMGLIYDVNDPTMGLNDARRWLRAGVPVVMSFTVPLSFLQNKGGYIGAPNEGERVMGAHTALVTGWVSNAAKPVGAPDGAGGGYFVIKNSWGRCLGDSGYYYVPVEWMRSNTLNLTVVF